MNSSSASNSGLTLVELLVAISILTIVTALLIPRLRIVNKDRNIRETARVVGSAFSAARERAIVEGYAGLIIERNLNFASQTAAGNVYYAGTRLTQLRAVTEFTGFGAGQGCNVFHDPTRIRVQIPDPREFDPMIDPNDFVDDSINIGGGHGRYLISSVTAPAVFMAGVDIDLILAWDDDTIATNNINTFRPAYLTGLPAPSAGSHGSFSIRRSPIESQASSATVDLPAGYMIDLRYSGPIDPGTLEAPDDPDTYTAFGLSVPATADPSSIQNSQIRILFNESGGIERVYFNGHDFNLGTLQLYISEFNPDVPTNDAQLAADQLLTVAENLWLTVGANGGVNIAYNAPPAQGDNVGDMITNARELSRSRISSNQ